MVRRGARKEQILQVAIDLIGQRGFHSVGIDDIGERAGITGPGVYRHFRNKDALLVAIFDRVQEDLYARANLVMAAELAPGEAVAKLVVAYATFTLDQRGISMVFRQEEANLPPADRKRFRLGQRAFVAQWVQAVGGVHPDLDEQRILALVHAAFGLVGSVLYYQPRLARQPLEDLLVGGATRLLLEPPQY